MSYPQPDADKYSIGGYPFFRLNTLLSSPGDIYESAQGSAGFAIGPDSDVANVNIAYYDEQFANNFMQFATISPARSLIGKLASRNDARYSPALRPGRFLIWIDDIYDPSYRPRAFSAVNDAISFIPPRLDVIQYFSPAPSLVPARVDKSFVFQNYIVSGGILYLVVPYYGRKYCYVNFTNRNATDPNTFGILGVNYAITRDDTVNTYHQETTIRAPAAVNSGVSVTKIITAGTTGVFDALVFSLSNAGPAPLRIVMSDNSQGT